MSCWLPFMYFLHQPRMSREATMLIKAPLPSLEDTHCLSRCLLGFHWETAYAVLPFPVLLTEWLYFRAGRKLDSMFCDYRAEPKAKGGDGEGPAC